MSTKDYQKAFIELSIQHRVLCFGNFTLKSGRVSPYFFNAGRFYSGAALDQLGNYYAKALMDSEVGFDLLFGPAYKGIPLASCTAVALARNHQLDVPVCYNRKEAKKHGEGGLLVGAPLQGRAVIIDDVITAGTAIREVMDIIQDSEANVEAVLIGLNRKERGQGKMSAIQEVEQQYGIPVISIIELDDIISYLQEAPELADHLGSMLEYRKTYGIF